MTAQKRILDWCDRVEIALSNVEYPLKNSYGYGFKRRRLSDAECKQILELHEQGDTIAVIAEKMRCGASTVSKKISDEKKNAPVSEQPIQEQKTKTTSKTKKETKNKKAKTERKLNHESIKKNA